jgi:uncharacterized membrane protein
MNSTRALTCLSGSAFLFYGILCFCSTSMGNDFHRFGMDNLRIPTGLLELLGGLGLLVGLGWAPAQRMASAGLTLLMLIAFSIRMRMRDSISVSMPSFLFMLLNLYIFVRASVRQTEPTA